MSDSNKIRMICDFCLPAAGKILLTPLRRSPYDGIRLFLPLLLPHQCIFRLPQKLLGRTTAARCRKARGPCGYPILFWNQGNGSRLKRCGRKNTGRKIPGRPKGERRRAAAGVPQAEGGRNEKYRFRFWANRRWKIIRIFRRHVSGTPEAGIKRPLRRQRTEIVTVRNFCRCIGKDS